MNDYALSKKADNNNPDRKRYSITDNNCGTFAGDVVKQDPAVKKQAPIIVDYKKSFFENDYKNRFFF